MSGLLVQLKRLYSQKTSRKNKISVSRALNILTALFSRGGIAFLILLIGSFVLTVESDVESHRRLETINIIPGNVQGEGWTHAEAIFVQDLSGDALFQAFTHENSAFISLERNGTNPVPANTNVDGNSIAPTNTEEISTPVEETGANAIEENDANLQTETTETDESESETNTSEEDPGNAAAPQSTPEVEPVPEENTVSLRSDVFGIFALLTELLPLAQESIIEPAPSESTEVRNDEDTETIEIVETESENETSLNEQTSGNVDLIEGGVDQSSAEERVNSEEERDIVEIALEEDVFVPAAPLYLSDFGIPPLESGQFITNVQLRLSLGATKAPQSSSDFKVRVEYAFHDEWEEAGVIEITDEISNAINGGYFLFALPTIEITEQFKDLRVRLVPEGVMSRDDSLFVDAAWVEIDTEIINRELLRERLTSSILEKLELPEYHVLLSDTLDFTRDQDPTFVLRYESQRNAAVRIIRNLLGRDLAEIQSINFVRKGESKALEIDAQIDTTNDGLWTIRIPEAARDALEPGTYTLEITVNEGGKKFTDSFDFQWGLLALNPHKSEYEVGESATIALAALSSNGNTLCDANLSLYVIDPADFLYRAPIEQSGLCNGNNVVSQPDYTALFTPTIPGTYELYLEHVGTNGEVLTHTEDTFLAVAHQPLSITRESQTRINPRYPYVMSLTISSDISYSGVLTERVRSDFEIDDTDASVTDEGDYYELAWNIDLGPGESKTVSYAYDAPDISPFLYTLGPATLSGTPDIFSATSTAPDSEDLPIEEELPSSSVDSPLEASPETPVEPQESETIESPGDSSSEHIEEPAPSEESTAIPGEEPVVSASESSETYEQLPSAEPTVQESIIESNSPAFTEHRAWKLASDATGSALLYWDGTNIPSGWTCVSCPTGAFYQRFVLASSTPGINGGTTTHTHTATGNVAATAATGVSAAGGGGADAALNTHTHTYTPTITTDSHLPPYRNLVLIQHNSAGEPASIPAGAIAMFDASVPSGWTQYAAQNGNYPRSESTSTIATTGGSATHTHTVGGTTGASNANTNAPGAAGVSTAANTHTHTVSTTTQAVNSEPPYIEAIFGKLNATSSPTDAMIAMWSDTPPTGWNTVSSSSEPFANRFVKANTTYGTTGGAATHTHSNISNIVTSAPSASVNRTADATNADANGAHTHLASVTSFNATTSMPLYRTAIFAKRQGGAPPDVTVHVLFDSEKTGTSTPRFEFTANDPDGADTLVYQFQWDDDGDLNDAPLLDRTSDNESGCSPNCFSNLVTGGDSSPFNDNERIRFTIQDSLTSGTTYYWRVRAKETIGDIWGSWTAVQSVTYVAGTDPSKWFQTQGSQFETGTLTNVATTSESVELSVPPPSEAMVVYGEGVVQTPRYQLWNGSAWDGELSAQSVGGTIQWIRTKAAPTRNEYITATQDAVNDVNVQVYNGTSSTWGNLLEVTTTIASTTNRGFDVAYETSSGDALVVYCDGDSDPAYRVWNGSSWSGATTITTTSVTNCTSISMASDPLSDEIIMVTRDGGTAYEAFVWNGSAWGNAQVLGSMTDVAHEGIAIEYEESGDQALVVVSNGGAASFAWMSWSGTAWSAVTTQALGDDFEWGVLKRDVGSDNMALCYIDQDEDVGIVRWNGLSWQTAQELDTVGNDFDGRPISCEFETTSGRDGYLMVPYSDTTNARYQFWNGSSLSGESSISTIQDSWEVGTVRTGDGTILAFFHDDVNTQYDFSYWNGSSWSAIQTLEGTTPIAAAPFRQPIDMVARIYQPSEGSIVSDPIRFTSVSGQPTWGEVSWGTTEPTGTNVLLQVTYGTSCTTTIPDLALPGNSAGFDSSASPLDLSALSTTTYSQICLKATLSSSNSNDPLLNDWTVSWEREPYITQENYRWYANTNAITPTDPWPVGAVNVDEDEAIVTAAPGVGSVMRLRLNLNVENVALSTSTSAFALQYATGTVCDISSTWRNVGSIGSTTAEWRGYNNTSVADGATVASLVLSTSDVFGTYEEENNSAQNPRNVSLGQEVEYDWVLEHNGQSGTSYCFRMVTENGVALNEYTQYPTLTTNNSPELPTLSIPFDNEKVPTTSPQFQFSAVDTEGESITYQIQIDDDYAFGSVAVDRNSTSNGSQFENLTTPPDKDPFNSGETMEFTLTSALTNGTTYYWRVRASDPQGSNSWGEWSSIQSFTVDTSLTASAWYQTMDPQFNTNQLDDVETNGSGAIVLSSGFTSGTAISDGIDFDWGTVGNGWGSLEFVDVESSSLLEYQIQYFENDTWSNIPDADLPGNSSGFDTSPVNLTGLDTDTYNIIRLVANFTDLGDTPSLLSWTLNWGFKILAPEINMLFPNERQAATTPTLEFFTSDPQGDDLVYQVQWSTSYTFTSSTTRTSDTDSGFANIDTPADTSPFFSNETIQFTVQPGDALTDNVTYWWRVRARDPLGTNQYSAFTDPQSFTVSSTTSVSTWFQTTSEQFLTDTLSGVTTTALQSVTVATTAVESLTAYAEGTSPIPRYRLWNGSAWGSEQQAQSVGAAVAWLVVKPGETREEYVMGTLGTDGDVNVQVYENGSWGNLQEITASVPNTTARGFDIAYENTSGDAIVVSCDGDADPTYYVWNGTSWTNGGTVNLASPNNCTWIRLMSDPVSDEIILMARDSAGSRYELFVWNGSTWGNNTVLGSMNEAGHEGVTGAYEESGDQAVVVASDGVNAAFVWKAWNGSAWSATTTVAIGDDFEAGSLVSDVGSDNMALCYIDEDNDIGAVRWTGAAFTGQVELEIAWAAGNTVKNDRPVDCAFEVGGARDGFIMVAYSDTANIFYQSWNGAAWSAEAAISTIQDSARVQLRRTSANLLQLLTYDITNDRYDYSDWNGTSWSAFQSLETDGSTGAYPYREPFMIAPRNPGSSGSVVGDPQINFYDGSGPYWQEMSWVDSEPGGSSILYSIEYWDGNSWEKVPDSAIPGNSAGISTSPINLSNMLPASTYSIIRPVADLICNLGTCPSLSDWTIVWSAGITLSGTAQQYNQSTNVTSGTVAVALNGSLQIGKTGTITAGGTWSIANVNASPGDIVTVFIDGAAESSEAVAVARYDGVGDMTGMRLYERHVTLGSDDATTTAFTNANIGAYDYTNDEDLFHNATGTSLAICVDVSCSDAELYIMASSTYRPTGSLTTHDLENNGTIIADGNTLTLTGSWDNNATTSMGTSTVTFAATSTLETIDGTGAASNSFYNIVFGTATNTATWTPITTLDADHDLTVSYGSLSRENIPITIGGNLITGAAGRWIGMGSTTFDGSAISTWSDQNNTLQNVGRVAIDGVSKLVQLSGNVRAQSIYIGSDDILDITTGNYNLRIDSNFINNNTFVARNGTTTFTGTTTGFTITAGGDAFYNLAFTGVGGAWSFSENTLSVDNDLTIATGTLTLPSGTTTIGGTFLNTGTFAHNNGAVVFAGSGAESIIQNATAFANAFYNAVFSGSGSWTFVEANATTTNDFRITQGTVTFPSGNLSVGGDFENTGGSFAANSGTVRFVGTVAHSIDTNAAFYNLVFAGVATSSFVDSNVTVTEDVTMLAGTTTLPSATTTIGGSFTNTASLLHTSGTVVFNSADTGETISLGSSPLNNITFNSVTGGWTIVSHGTTTSAFTLTNAGSFALASGQTLAVGGTFTNSVGGASTTWTGSTLSLESGSFSLNNKTNTGDVYETLRVKPNTDIKMWNSSAFTYTVDSAGSLYSQDHATADGDLYIFGGYERATGTEYWSYATDFDGTSLGTSSRQVDVRFASGANATFSSSTLSVVGTTTATTTIRNQGSGSYTIAVSGGTTTLQYYDFGDLGTSGVSLQAGTKVTTLGNGRFNPGVNTGTGLTVSSQTIDANPGLQIFTVEFATTTAIAASNVIQNGGSPTSYWWFRESTGNLDGEAFDNDTGDPGSIRWDDSSLTIAVSGVVYDDDGSTPLGAPTCGAGTPVRVIVENGNTYDGACDGSGAYSIPNVTIIGDPTLTVFLNGAAGGERAVTVTKTPTANITNLDLISGRVIVRHEDVSAITIADMTAYDGSDDTDIPYLAATGTLTVHPDTGLHVFASSTFTPQGTVTLSSGGSGTDYDGTLYLGNSSTFTGAGTTTYTIGGSFIQGAGAHFVPASSTVAFTATTTGKGILSQSGESISFHNVGITGIGGGWNITGGVTLTGDLSLATGTLTGTGNITLANGSMTGNGLLSLGAGTTTLASTNTLGGTQAWTFGNLVLGTGSTTGTTSKASTATTTVLGKLTIGTGHFFNAYGSLLNLMGSGNVFVENGTFNEATSTVRYGGTSGSNVISTNYYNLMISSQGGSPTYSGTGLGIVVNSQLLVGGTASTTFTLDANDPALDVNGNIVIEPNGTLIGSGSGTFTLGGSWDNNGTYTASGGTITFDGSGVHTIAAGNSPFSNIVINGTGDFTVSEAATTTSAFTLTAANDFRVGNNSSLAIGGTFTNSVGGADTDWSGSTLYLYGGGNYTVNSTSTSDTYNRLAIGANTQVRTWNSEALLPDLVSSASLYSQDHAAVNGDLYIYGAYTKNSGTDYWSYATDFDGTSLAGSERQVDVRVAGGASVLYQGGGLSVVGAGAGSTTVQNQGSGTYSFRIGGTASTTFSYYEIANTDINGLTFSGSPTVVNLSNGKYTVGVASGTAITVGGTAINQNPAKTFTNNNFSTSTGGLAFNVTATGTSVSSWRFTNHSGAIDGEAYDVDPNGDPGYIVWDDSAQNISISGRIYSDEGTTASAVCDGSTNNVHLRVQGLTSYTTTCAAGTGVYSISGITYSPGDSIVVYIDGEAEKGATISEDPVTSINNFDLYENRVIIRHEGSDSLSIADMSVWDSSDDADIPFTAVDANPDTLSLPANRKLIVWTGKEFEPQGNVTLTGGGGGAAYDGTLELFANALFDAAAGESHSVGGSFILGAGATFDDETSTFTFTTTGVGRTIDTNDESFYNIVLNGTGSWTISNTILTVGNDFTLTQGVVTLPSATTTISGSFVNNGGTFNQNGGSMYFNSSAAESIRPGVSAFGTTTFNGTGNWTYLGGFGTTTGDFTVLSGSVTAPTGTLTVGGDFINNGTYTHSNGTVRMTSALASTSIDADSSDLYSVTIAGTGTFVFTDPTEALLGSLTLLSGTTTLPTSTLSVGGSFNASLGAFVHSTGTVLLNSSDVGETINPGSSTFNHLTIAAPGGGYTITGNATTTGNFSLTSAASFELQSGRTLGVYGIFTNLVGGNPTTWSGSTVHLLSGTGYTVNTKVAGGDVYNILTLGNDTDLRLWNSSATTSLSDQLSSLYSQDNGGIDGELYVYGNYTRSTGADYWSAETDFDGAPVSARAVAVRHAANATSTFSGGSLEIIGTGAATTTITNQGSGTYALGVYNGTLNAQRYAVRNINASGFVLAGETPITSLNYGDFELAVAGGALMTVSSTTVNYNAASVFTGLRFATTTPITGVNMALVGTTSAAWTLTAHTGNLDGEAFDDDGADACGAFRWQDSTCLLTQQSAYRWRNDNGGEGVPDSEWIDVNWSKRKRITVTNTDATTYTNAVVQVTVPFDSDMQADFDDLRVTDRSGTTTLSFTRETYTPSTEAVLWIKIPTLTASADTSLYLYYGNGAATYGGVGTTTFIAYDDFEDDNISEYSGDTSLFDTDTTFAYQGTYGLEASDPNDRTIDGIYRTSTTISQGETIRFFQYVDTSAGSGDETCTLFGVQSPGSNNNNYAVCLEQFGIDRVSISKNVTDADTSGTVLATTSISYTTGWYEIEVDWATDDSISVSVLKDNILVATTSATDSSYTSGGFGFTFWFQNGGWDYYTARPLLTTEPSVALSSSEQVRGGASWAAALNTLINGVDVGTIVRPRFLIENTGLQVTDQYQLLFAAKGNAPSCEAVGAGSYTAVPPQASCGSSAVCMQSSSNFSNNASTTDVLGGAGTFTSGQIIEDPSNKTNALTLNGDYFTEVEYAIAITANASDASYCFRVSDNGTAIDSYTRVAELGLVFEPNITSLVFNDGIDINLLPGATTTIYATGTVSDQNGYADIVAATTTMFRSGVGGSCSVDTNNCYIAGPSQCTYTNCAGNSCDIVCRSDFYFHADPTDVGTYAGETWRALLTVEDAGGFIATATAPSIDLLTLRAIEVDSLIDYGTLEVNANTGSYNATTTFVNEGNDSVDVSIEGSNLSDGVTSVIPASEQIFATSTFSYSACVYCTQLSTSSLTYELDLTKPATSTPSVVDQVFWGIEIPYGISAAPHYGINTFYAVGD